MEGDRSSQIFAPDSRNFNPLPPCGGRRPRLPPHPSGIAHFNPLPPCGGRHILKRAIDLLQNFNPLPPCGGRQQNCTAFLLKSSNTNAILTKKNTDTLLHARKNTFFLIFSQKKRVRIPRAFSVRLGFAPERFLRTKAAPLHRWFPLHRYVPLSFDTDFPDSRTGGCPSRHQWHPSAAV